MEEKKQWYASKTVWMNIISGLVLGLVSIAPIFGADTQELGEAVQENAAPIADNIVAGVLSVINLIAIYGRVTASKKIGK